MLRLSKLWEKNEISLFMQANKLSCTVSWILTEYMRLLVKWCPETQFPMWRLVAGGGSSHLKKIILRRQWMSKNSTQLWHYVPRDSFRFHKLRVQFYKTAFPPLHFGCQSQAQAIIICTSNHWPYIRGSHDLLFGFN